MQKDSKRGLATLAVHAGSELDLMLAPGVTPIYQSSTFKLTEAVYSSMRENRARDELIYTRYDNPSIRSVERKIASLEGAEDALVFSSGMGAISAVLETFLKPGDRLVCGRDLYGGTHTLVTERLPSLGIRIELVPTDDSEAWHRAFAEGARLAYCESITNPVLKLADLRQIADLAHRAGALAVVDNTFATPVNLRPLELGMDLVIHSGSKYLGGHSDLICGAVSGTKAMLDEIWRRRTIGGACLDPHAAFLLERGMKTLAIRVERQNHNAITLARFLESREQVIWVSYPGLTSHPQHQLADKILDGSGGMIAFAVKSDGDGLKLMKQLRLIREATSLGGVESVISMPMNTSQALWSWEQLAEAGIRPGTLRLSCGIEDIDDLIADLEEALDEL